MRGVQLEREAVWRKRYNLGVEDRVRLVAHEPRTEWKESLGKINFCDLSHRYDRLERPASVAQMKCSKKN
jgi:hypothetical protein